LPLMWKFPRSVHHSDLLASRVDKRETDTLHSDPSTVLEDHSAAGHHLSVVVWEQKIKST